MADSKKSKLQKKLEMLKRTQEITSFVEQSSIKSIATLGGAEDSQPVEESHALDLLEEESVGRTAPHAKKRSKKITTPKHHKPKMKTSGRRPR